MIVVSPVLLTSSGYKKLFQIVTAANVTPADKHLGYRRTTCYSPQTDGGGILSQHNLFVLNAAILQHLLSFGTE